MPSLRAFHVLFIGAAIMLSAGVGVWGLMNARPGLGAISFVVGLALIAYSGYFARKSRRIRTD